MTPEERRARRIAQHKERMKDPEYARARQERHRQWRQNHVAENPELKHRVTAWKYGMSPAEYLAWYDRILKQQNGGCGICSRKPTKDKRLHVDHDHETGRLRGLLCYSCNTRLAFVDNYRKEIVKYLRTK